MCKYISLWQTSNFWILPQREKKRERGKERKEKIIERQKDDCYKKKEKIKYWIIIFIKKKRWLRIAMSLLLGWNKVLLDTFSWIWFSQIFLPMSSLFCYQKTLFQRTAEAKLLKKIYSVSSLSSASIGFYTLRQHTLIRFRMVREMLFICKLREGIVKEHCLHHRHALKQTVSWKWTY